MGNYYVSLISCVTGGATAFYAFVRIVKTLIFLAAAEKTRGTIVGFAAARDSDRRTTYIPIAAFRTVESDQIISFNATVAANPPDYKIGEQVEVLFPAKNPAAAKINSFTEMWLTTIVFLLIGFFLLAIAFFARQG